MEAGIVVFDSVSKQLASWRPGTKLWYQMQGLHEDLINFSAVVVRDHIYALTVTQKVYRLKYSDLNSTWQQMCSMTENHGFKPPAVVLGDSIYVIGGARWLPTATGETLYLSKNTWIRIQDMHTHRSDHAIVSARGFIYCIGGENKFEFELNSVERYDPKHNTWIYIKPMKQARHSCCAVELNGKIYVMGGLSKREKLTDVECYDIMSGAWTSASQMHKARSWFSACATNNKIFAVGDEDELTRRLHTIEVFDAYTNQWSLVEEIKGMQIWAALTPASIKPENVTARKSNTDFVVSWDRSDSIGLIYFIKVFCEDEELEGPHTTTELEYRYERPVASKKYFFEVWAQNNSIESEKTRSNVITSYRGNYAASGVYYDIKFPLRKNYKVFRGELDRNGKVEDVAVKLLEFDTDENRGKEIENMQRLIRHVNTVEYKMSGVMDGNSGISTYIVMELCDTPTLYEIIKLERDNLSDEDLKEILLQITCGLQHIHERGLIHRDLKPQNVLRSLDKRSIKLTDFGLSKEIDPDRSIVTKSGIEIGTDGWGSPEHYENVKHMSKKSDIYSAGLLFYFVLTKGDHVFGNDRGDWKLGIIDGSDINLSGLRCPNANHAKRLITWMLDRDPNQRPTAKQILDDPFFTS